MSQITKKQLNQILRSIHPDSRNTIKLIIQSNDDYCEWSQMIYKTFKTKQWENPIPFQEEFLNKDTAMVILAMDILICHNDGSHYKQKCSLFTLLPEEMKMDDEIIMIAIRGNPDLICQVPKYLITKEMAKSAIQKVDTGTNWNRKYSNVRCIKISDIYQNLLQDLQQDEEILRLCVEKDYTFISHLPIEFINDIDFIHKLVKMDGRIIMTCHPARLLDRHEIIKSAISQNPLVFKKLTIHCPTILQNSEIVEFAILRDGRNYEFIPGTDKFKYDKGLLIKALISDKRNGIIPDGGMKNVHLFPFISQMFYSDENIHFICRTVLRGNDDLDYRILRRLLQLNVPFLENVEELVGQIREPIVFSALPGDDYGELEDWIFQNDLKEYLIAQHPQLENCDIGFGDFSICETEFQQFLEQYLLEEQPTGMIVYPEEDDE